MPQSRPAILLTRPERQAARFAKRLRERLANVPEILISPLIEIEFIPDPAPIRNDASLVFTSENGVLAYTRNKPAEGRIAWCVGPRTGSVAEAAGFAVQSGGGDAGHLLQAIRAAWPAGPLIHYRGQHARGDIAANLRGYGLNAEERITYRQKPLPLSDEARGLIWGESPVLVPLFSPRSAALFVKEAGNSALRNIRMIALSRAVADMVQNTGLQVAAIAAEPNADAMIAAMEGLMDA